MDRFMFDKEILRICTETEFPLRLWCSINENLHQEISAYLFSSLLFMSSNILQVLQIFPPLNWPEIVSLIEINPTSLIGC